MARRAGILMTCKVVVADDNRDAADTLAALLMLDGHDVQVAHNGERALAIIISFRPHLALLDITMPGLDGYEIAQRVRQIDSGSGDRVMLAAVTGWGQAADVQRAKVAGYDHHFVKPLDSSQILALLTQIGCEVAQAPAPSAGWID
jgi:CheY-like chemotaxis protein